MRASRVQERYTNTWWEALMVGSSTIIADDLMNENLTCPGNQHLWWEALLQKQIQMLMVGSSIIIADKPEKQDRPRPQYW